MSEDDKGVTSGREQGLAEAAVSVNALREALAEPKGAKDEGAVEASASASKPVERTLASKAGASAEGASEAKPAATASAAESRKAEDPTGGGKAAARREASVSAPGPGGAAEATGAAPSAGRSLPSATRELDDELDDEAVSRELRGGSWRRWGVLGLLVAFALGVGAVVLLGQRNGERYVLRCTAEHIVAQKGRGFPPWGERALSGKQWKPIPLPLAAECRTRQAQSEVELSGWYAEALMEQAGQVLAAGKLEQLEAAAAQLEQAALLTRAPERRAERAQLQRLWGDVEYGRALAKLAEARQALAEAARGLDEAAKREPRYATDAAARARELRRLLAELGAPGAAEAGAPVSPLPAPAVSEPSSSLPPEVPAVPAGTTSAPEATGSASSGPPAPTAPAPTGPPAPTAPGAPVPPAGASGSSPGAADPAAPDAGPTPVPAGGVLL